MYKQLRPGRTFIGRIDCNEDLLGALALFCRKHAIRAGIVSLIGAVQRARFGYYDQKKKAYTGCAELEKRLEIVSCSGNISFKDGEIFVHSHIVVADLKGSVYGGHLMPGTIVFAAEFFIQELRGGTLVRTKNAVTGLPLWM